MPRFFRTAPRPRRSSLAPDNPAWWRHLFVESENAQIVCDRAGVICEANERASMTLGLSASTQLFQCGVLPPAVREQLKGVLGGSTVEPWELGNVGLSTPAGACIVSDLHVVSLTSERWLIAFKDNSRRWRLETHTQRLLAAIDSTPDVVVLTDARFLITFVNPAFEEATGYTFEEALGRAVDSFQAPEEKERTREYLEG